MLFRINSFPYFITGSDVVDEEHGMEDTDIQATFDSVNGNAYVILSNENKNGG